MKLAGKLLIAMPRMGDARFEGTLILVCVHSEEGAMGLIVNRARRDVSFPQLLAAMGIETTGSARADPGSGRRAGPALLRVRAAR